MRTRLFGAAVTAPTPVYPSLIATCCSAFCCKQARLPRSSISLLPCPPNLQRPSDLAFLGNLAKSKVDQ